MANIPSVHKANNTVKLPSVNTDTRVVISSSIHSLRYCL